MSERKWNREPWAAVEGVDRGSLVIIASDIDDAIVASVGFDMVDPAANAARIVTCVNAMAGIEDPAAIRADFEALAEAVADAEQLMRELSGHNAVTMTTVPWGTVHQRLIAALSRASVKAVLGGKG